MSNTVKIYFSFRSPYSWLALYRIYHVQSDLPVDFELIPCFPPPDSGGALNYSESKKQYIGEDIKRFADAYGLELCWPEPFDTDWKRPHSAFVYANEQSAGMDFCLNAYSARFSEGLDIGRDDVIIGLAEVSRIDPDKTVNAADDSKIHRSVMKGMLRGNRDGLFGVPLFVYEGRKYWGNDRVEWLIRDIYQKEGKVLPDLKEDPFQHPFK